MTVMRGTPVMIQLLIIYYVILASVQRIRSWLQLSHLVLNSAAYVAEIDPFRYHVSGHWTVRGRTEVLGLNYQQTMQSIVLPQAIKNILPALAQRSYQPFDQRDFYQWLYRI